jgi:HipA-like protein
MKFKSSDSALEVYAEGRVRRTFVGTLRWLKEVGHFEFTYDKKYLLSKRSIAIGPELPLSKRVHVSREKLFPSFQDRIPSKDNPAYEEYCRAVGISPKERNPIILLTAIGRRGPSAFVFEAIVETDYDAQKELGLFRARYRVSLHEMALALDLNAITLQRIESGKSKDPGTGRLLEIFLSTPAVLRQQLKLTARKIHRNTLTTMMDYADTLEAANR